ncbi:alpha/beta hydrolase [Lacibacter sp. H407]|uniref:alpha/beta hydrolase n=1 Tax=Lacibacter sp. H407 TaxID=3133423 RepID=UPI0030C14970
MNRLLIILLVCSCRFQVFAQSYNGITNVTDTTFNLRNEFEKVKKQYPAISIPVDQRSAFIAEQRNIRYYKPANRNLELDAFFPKQNKGYSKKTPAIIIIHGGGWRSGNKSQHHALAFNLAAKGYACFTPEYRLSTEALYPAAVQDIKAVVKWVKSNADKFHVDTNRIVVLGFSAGGQLAALVGTTNGYQKLEPAFRAKATSNVHAIVDIDGTLSFVHPESGEGDDSKRTSAATYWFGYSKTENPELWKQASPLTHAGAFTPPTLFINSSVARMHAGRNDFMQLLRNNNIYTEVKEFENSPHSFCLFEPWFTPTVEAIDTFLQNVFPKK